MVNKTVEEPTSLENACKLHFRMRKRRHSDEVGADSRAVNIDIEERNSDSLVTNSLGSGYIDMCIFFIPSNESEICFAKDIEIQLRSTRRSLLLD